MQQINLYQPIFRREKKLFTAVNMLYGLAIVLIGLLALYGWGFKQLSDARDRLQAAERQRAERVSQLEQMIRLRPELQKDGALAAQIERLEQRLGHRRQVLSALDGRAVGNRAGFAGYLEGLARHRQPDLWLTRVAIRGGGEAMELAGSTRAPEQLPRLLQALSGEAVFEGAVFKSMRMDRAENGDRIDFVLSTDVSNRGDEAQ